MVIKGKIVIGLILIVALTSLVSAAQVCEVYDNFDSGTLDISKWDVRQDLEGQPFMGEYEVLDEGVGFVYHMQQNTIGDRRVFLVPKYQLKAGESFKYGVNLISKEGHYGSAVLLVGEEYPRLHLGAAGFSSGIVNFDELGQSYRTIEFSGNNFTVIAESPSGELYYASAPVQNTSGNYELYIGAWSGHNGKVHMDFDDFTLCSEEPEPSVEERLSELEERVMELEESDAEMDDRVSKLERLVKKIIKFLQNLPSGLSKNWTG